MSALIHGRVPDVINDEYRHYTEAESDLKKNLAEMKAKTDKDFAKLEKIELIDEFPSVCALGEAFNLYTDEVDQLSGLLTEEDLAKGLYWDFVYGYVNFARTLERIINVYAGVAEIADAN